ncbi:MAG TPA: nickel-dependent hydrogenase large subunit [Alphaproteobacteria bacterium]
MTDLIQFLHDCPVVSRHRPWPRIEVDAAKWQMLAARLPMEEWELLALWGEPDAVHVALHDPQPGTFAVLSRACPGGGFASLSTARPGALRLERAARDLFGLVPEGIPDARPWLDHGRWPMRRPLATAPEPRSLDEPAARATDYPFLPVTGKLAEQGGLHQIPVGPIHAGIIEPGHFRFTANGETVVRLEERLGYVHKGIEKLMQGRTLADAASLAGRISGDSTVAHALAFARAVEAALDVAAPPRAHYLRAIMAELERVANHLGDFGAICNDAAFSFILAEASTLREDVLRAAHVNFGHRLMMDKVIPGGVAVDLFEPGIEALRRLVGRIRPRVLHLAAIYDGKPSLLDRTIGTGTVARNLVQRFAAGGYVGRASGRAFDARRTPGYPPYDDLEFEVPILDEGDVHARVWIRIREIGESIRLIEQCLERLPGGAIAVPLPQHSGEGIALVEGFRGDILTSVKLAADGTVVRCHARDPSWLQWPLLEAAVEGNIVADFPLCNKSFNCSYAGHDL